MTNWLLAIGDEWIDGKAVATSEVPGPLVEPVHSLIAGNAQLAGVQLEKVLDSARGDATVAVLAVKLGWCAEARRYNLLPGGAGTGALDVRARWDARARLAKATALARDLGPTQGAVGRWIDAMASLSSTAASLRGTRRDPSMRDMLLQILRGSLADVRADAPEGALPFVERALAELAYHAGDVSLARADLERALAAAHDEAAVLSCEGLAFDLSLCELSSPLVRNVEIDEASGPTSDLAWNVEAQEWREVRASQEQHRQLAELRERAASVGSRLAGAFALRQAYVASRDGDTGVQIARCDEAVALFSRDGDVLHTQLARTHGMLARLEAGKLGDQSDIARAIGAWGRRDGSFSYALGLGLLLTRAARAALVCDGDYERADAALRLALVLDEELGAPLRVAQCHADLASVHRTVGNRDRARMHLESSLDRLVEVAGEQPDHLEVQQRVAMLTQELFADAVAHKDAPGIAAAQARIEKLNSTGDGLAGFAIQSLLASLRAQARVLIPLYTGTAHLQAGDELAAERQLKRALAEASSPGDAGTPFVAIVHATARRYPDALKAYDEYLHTGGASQGLTGQLIAAAQGASSAFAERERRAAKLRQAQMTLTFMVRIKEYQRARAAYEEVVELAGPESWLDDPKPWQPLSDIGEMLEGVGRPAEAATYFQRAIDELEERRARMSRDELRTALGADQGAAYLYVQATRNELRRLMNGDLERAAHAFELSERGRARALLDLVAANLRRPTEGEPEILGRWRALTTQSQVWGAMIARMGRKEGAHELAAKLAACELELAEVTTQLEAELPSFAAAVRPAATVASLDDVRRALPVGTALLQYTTLGEHLLAWAITRDGMRAATVTEVRESDLARLTRDFCTACGRGADEDDVSELGAKLAAQLLAPFDSILHAHEHLVIVPSGELHRLPWSALPWHGEWLGASKTISTVPSATLFAQLPRRRAEPRTLLAVGAPQNMSQPRTIDAAARPLPPLPGTRVEASFVASLFGTTPLLDEDATRANVLGALHDHGWFHFATHGYVDADAPLLSGIALSNGESLTVQDLLGVRFDAELVTMSACRTGLGTLTKGEETVGLSRGLLAAGARCLLVSLWPVKDGVTALLMRRFYEQLAIGIAPRRALQAAQHDVRALTDAELSALDKGMRDVVAEEPPPERHATHPLNWAAFEIIGVWEGE